MTPRPARLVLGALALLAGALATPTASVGAGTHGGQYGFATPTIVDPVNLFGEPDLRADPARPGTWYSSGPWGTGTQRSIWDRSTDGARTFRELHEKPDPLHTGNSLNSPGGGDTEIAADHNGRLYLADLAALVTQNVRISDDGGHTFTTQQLPPQFQSADGTDRQWFGLWDPPAGMKVQSAYHGPFPVNYMVYLEAAAGSGETVASSVPNGNDRSRVGLDYSCGPSDMGPGNCPNWALGGDGFIFCDQLTGKVVQAIDTGYGPAVEVIAPGANGYMDPASARRHTIADLAQATTGAIFPVATEDSQRNAYVIWVERPALTRTSSSWQVYYSWSPPGADSQWDHWSAPIRVSQPPSNTAVMPWAIAGGNGNLDVAWYGTDAMMNNTDDETDPVTAGATWYLYSSQVLHADSAHPSITMVRAADHPMHHGSICLAGLGCIAEQGNRNLADFFEITTDASGAAYIVFNNTANDLIQTGVPGGVADHAGAEVTEVVRQSSGPGLYGGAIDTASDRGVWELRSPSGDAVYDGPQSSTNYPGLDIVRTSVRADSTTLHVNVTLSDASAIQAAATAVGAPFVDVVVRWELNSKLYFAEAELPAGSTSGAQYYAGGVAAVDLCSVSACDPHITVYPGPGAAPTTSHTITGAVNAPDNVISMDVPLSDVGSPSRGDQLVSVGAYSFVQLESSNVQMPNPQAEADVVPVEVDGACCFTTPSLGDSSSHLMVRPQRPQAAAGRDAPAAVAAGASARSVDAHAAGGVPGGAAAALSARPTAATGAAPAAAVALGLLGVASLAWRRRRTSAARQSRLRRVR